jgi:chemotaxis methyl-accepting protein methylase
MDAVEEFDLISSNGLNIYVKDKEQVIALYQKFFDALKPGGTLV